MTAVASLDHDSDLTPSSSPSEEDLLDVLYEVLAQGIPPRSSLTREEVERFLHEHARERKPISEMVRFFERHSLPTHASLYGADHALGELASGLQKERGSIAPGFLPAPEHVLAPVSAATDTGAVRALTSVGDEATGRHKAQLELAKRRNIMGMGLAVLLGLVLLAGFIFSYERSSTLEQRLEQARMQQRSTDVALTKLEERAEVLQGALKESEADRRATAVKLEAIMNEERSKRASEEAALERVLGARYRNLREKLTNEAVSASP